MKVFVIVAMLLAWWHALLAQEVTISLREALERARQYGTQVQSADIAAQLAKEDRKQAVARPPCHPSML